MFTTQSLRALAALSLASAALAGPLSPPVGPVTSTIGPEPRTPISTANTPGDADSLFRISQPGSYYLTGNITGVVGKSGIEIASSNVTIDLMGFQLTGIPGMGVFDGVTVSSSFSNITILNGTVIGWGSSGVNLGNASSGRIDGVSARANTFDGIVLGTNFVVSRCVVSSNLSGGIRGSSNTTIQDCTAVSNTSHGFSGGFNVAFSNCTAFQNGGSGFQLSAACVVSGCTASFNSSIGIDVNNGSTVNSCVALGNTQDGIRCTFGALIINNNCDQNGNGGGNGAGIHATGNTNRIEGNNCTQADRGIDIDLAGNIIIRNACANNTTDWDIVANNVFGPIIDRRAPASPAVSGFTAASTLGSTDANANYSY